MEAVLETTPQCDPAVSDSDSGASLFVTQSVSSAEREVQRRCSPRRPSRFYSRNSQDESESHEDGETEKGPDALPSRDSDSDSTVSGLAAMTNKLPLPEPQHNRVRRRSPPRPRRLKFPFLKSQFGRLTVGKNQILVNAEVGGFFKAVKKLREGHSKRRRELNPKLSRNGRKLVNDTLEEDNEDSDDDIRKVDAACFIGKRTNSKTTRKLSLAEKSKEGRKKGNQTETRKPNERRSNRPAKVAGGLTESRDALSKSISASLNVSQRKGGKGGTKSRKSARSSTDVSKVLRTLFVDQEENGQKEPEILVTGSQSQAIDDCWPTQDGTSASETSLRGSDDETVVQETQWSGLTGQSEEGCQSGRTEEGEELCVGDGSSRERDNNSTNRHCEHLANEDIRLESAPDRTMVASPLRTSRIVSNNENTLETRYITRSLSRRSCQSTPEKEDNVNSRASENLEESLKVKYGLSAQIKIPLLDCLVRQADNTSTLRQKEEMKQQTQAAEENVAMQSCHVGTMVLYQDFKKETTMEDGQKKKEQGISSHNEEQHEDMSRCAELKEMQATPNSSPSKTRVSSQGSPGVGGSISDESLHNEDAALDSGRCTSSQDFFEEPNNQADVTMVSSSFIEFITTSDDEDTQENAMPCDESKKKNEDRRSEILNIEEDNAEYSEQTPECHAPELMQESSENQDTVARVGVASVSLVECPSGSNVSGASSPSKDILMVKRGQETQIDTVESPLFNLGGFKSLQRKKRKKADLSQGHNPPLTQERLHERFMPSHDVSKQKKSEKNPVFSDQHSDAPSTEVYGIKTKDTSKKDKHTVNERNSQDEASKDLLSDASEPEKLKKNKAKKRRLCDELGFGTIETDVEERPQEMIFAATRSPSETLAEPLKVPSSTEIQPVICQSLPAGQYSEVQSTDDCKMGDDRVKTKKKVKNKVSSLTIWAGQDEDPKQDSSTEVHSQDSSKDLVQSDGSEPVKKKKRTKAKDKAIPIDMVTFHHAEQSKSGNDTTEINDGERQEEEIPSECLVSISDVSTQLVLSGHFSPQYSSTQVHSEDRQYLDLSDGSSPVKKKKKKKKDSPDDMVTPQSEEQKNKSGYGSIETNSGEAQGENITAATGPPSETLAESLKDNCDISSSIEFQQVMFQDLQAGQDSEAQSTDDCGVKVKRKKKKNKHMESLLSIQTDQDEDPQMPSQELSKDLILSDGSESVKKKKRKKAKDTAIPDDMVTLHHAEQSKSGNDTTETNTGERQEEMPSECLVSNADGSTQLTQGGLFSPQYSSTQVHTEASKDLDLSDISEAAKKKKKKKAKEKDSPDDMVSPQSEEQSTNSGEAEEAQFTEDCGIKAKKKAKHKESSLKVWTGEDEDSQMPNPSSECQSSMASGPEQLQYNIRTEDHKDPDRELKTSDGSQTIKKKKGKKRGYCTTESTTGENEGDEIITATNPSFETIPPSIEIQPVMCQALQAGQDSEAQSTEYCGANMKKKKKKHKPKESSVGQDEDPQLLSSSSDHWSSLFSHQDSSTEVHRDLVPCDGSEPVKKKKKKYSSDDMVTLQHAENSKSGCDITAEETQDEEIITASRELTEDHEIKVKKKKKKVKHDEDLLLMDGSEPLKKRKKAKERHLSGNVVTLQDAEQFESGHGSSKSKFGERQGEEMTSASRESVEGHGMRGKKKRKEDIKSDLVSMDDGFYQLSGTDPRENELRQKDGGTEVEKASKDHGSKPLGKKKGKKMDSTLDMVTVHCAENSEPSRDATKVKTVRKKDRKKESFVEDPAENITNASQRSETSQALHDSDPMSPSKKKKRSGKNKGLNW